MNCTKVHVYLCRLRDVGKSGTVQELQTVNGETLNYRVMLCIICALIIVRLKLITAAKQLTVNKAFIKVTKTYVFGAFKGFFLDSFQTTSF